MASYSGNCFCGKVKVNVSGPIFNSFYCHCTICRRLTGSPFVALAVVSKANAHFEGEVENFSTSEGTVKSRCKYCGTPVLSIMDKYNIAIFPLTLFTSTGRPVADLAPKSHVFYEDRIVDVKDGLPKHKQGGNSETMSE